MMKKDEEKKKKEEKDKLKKQQKEERRQQYQKEAAKQAEKNPFSVFAEKDGQKVMDDDSAVFTEPSSSDHPPKGTLSRLQLT